jgi:membrane protease YdiL (CAAX protease family)
MLLISLVGCMFGWARHETGSTAVAAIMHSTFNLTQFALYLWRTRTL